MISFQPAEGSVLYCDYYGFKVPEMIKKRPVIVTRRHRHNRELVTIVPISLSKPNPLHAHHIPMPKAFCDAHLQGKESWVKCDMINVVSIERLYKVKGRDGARYVPVLDVAFLGLVKSGMKISQEF